MCIACKMNKSPANLFGTKKITIILQKDLCLVLMWFLRLLFDKKNELGGAADKLRNGLSKIDDTRQKVEKMSIELEDAKTKVAQFQKQCDEYLVIIVQQKREADEQQKVTGAK